MSRNLVLRPVGGPSGASPPEHRGGGSGSLTAHAMPGVKWCFPHSCRTGPSRGASSGGPGRVAFDRGGWVDLRIARPDGSLDSRIDRGYLEGPLANAGGLVVGIEGFVPVISAATDRGTLSRQSPCRRRGSVASCTGIEVVSRSRGRH